MPSDAGELAFGDIILVPLPFTNQEASKRRPAVVVSAQSYNITRPDIIVMAVTSQQVGAARVDDVQITSWEAAGLLKPSAIKPVIATLQRTLVVRHLGSLGPEDRDALKTAIGKLLG